jgi:hypothetical protein
VAEFLDAPLNLPAMADRYEKHFDHAFIFIAAIPDPHSVPQIS